MLELLQYEGMPNKFHYFLALALKRGSRVLTTNFDTRIEEAARILGISAPRLVVGPTRRMRFQQRYRLVKLHGSFTDDTDPSRSAAPSKPTAVLSHIGKTGLMFRRLQPFQRQLLAALKNKTLVVLGYSASDSFDVVPFIETAGFRRVVWNVYSRKSGLREHKIRAMDERFLIGGQAACHEVTLGILQRRGPRIDVHLIEGPLDEFLTKLFPALMKVNEQRSSIFLGRTRIRDHDAALSELREFCQRFPLSRQSRRMICRHLLREHSGLWEELPLSTPGVGTRGFRGRRRNPSTAKDDIYAKAQRFLDSGQFDAAFRLLYFHPEVRKLPNEPPNIDARIFLLDTVCLRHFLARNFRRALAYANRSIGFAERHGIIWAAIRGVLRRARVHMQLGFDTALRKRRSPYPSFHYFAIAERELSFVIYFSQRIPRRDLYFEAQRSRMYLCEATSRSEEARELGQRLISLFRCDDDPEVQGVTHLHMADLASRNRRFAEAVKHLRRAEHFALKKKRWQRGKLLCELGRALLAQAKGESDAEAKLLVCRQRAAALPACWDIEARIDAALNPTNK